MARPFLSASFLIPAALIPLLPLRKTVLVQREMERGRSPLVSIPPHTGGDFQGIRVYRSDVFWEERERQTFAPKTSSR